MKFSNILYFLSRLLTLLFLCLMLSCAVEQVNREIKKVDEISTISPDHKYIKVHMKDGTVYILYDYRFVQAENKILGYGSLLDINRKVIEKQAKRDKGGHITGKMFQVDLDDVSLIETNDKSASFAGGLTVLTGVTTIVGVICIVNPKACFGSCPTFYASDGDTLTLQAEGFSASIAPSLENNDIDMLYDARPDHNFELTVTNDALETHSIRYVHLLAFEKKKSERIFATPEGIFYRCTHITPPASCMNDQGDYTRKVSTADGNEYFSLADSSDLNCKEELIVSFPAHQETKGTQPGLVIGKRQTLLTTFLLYQGFSYMGNGVGHWMAELEQGKNKSSRSVFSILGGIEVYSKDSADNWRFEGMVNETGPIATDFNIIPLSVPTQKEITLKLRMNKGLWRIDYLALASLSGEVVPDVIEPYYAGTIRGRETSPLEKLTNEHTYLVTYPGDQYRMNFNIPFEDAELFIDTKGYYLEWIRDEWIQEQDFRKLNVMINKPGRYLKKAAPAYKKIEPLMEKTFWESKYVER